MARWSIHQEEDLQYTVRLGAEQEMLDKMPGSLVTATDEERAAKAEASRGTQVNKPFGTREEAVLKLSQLENKERQDMKIAAAKELLGV